MSAAMWLLVVAWGVLAAVSSIPWFAHAGSRVIEWMRNPALVTIVALHAVGLVGPVVAGVGLWRGRFIMASAALGAVSVAWLFWHIFTFTKVAWIARDAPRVLLSILTLGVVLVHAVAQARREAS